MASARVTKQHVIDLQERLLQAQDKIISLQDTLQRRVPAEPAGTARWHVDAELTVEETLQSNDPELLQRYLDWTHAFGEEHLRPYLHPFAYNEVMYHMQHAVIRRLAELELVEQTNSPLPTALFSSLGLNANPPSKANPFAHKGNRKPTQPAPDKND